MLCYYSAVISLKVHNNGDGIQAGKCNNKFVTESGIVDNWCEIDLFGSVLVHWHVLQFYYCQ